MRYSSTRGQVKNLMFEDAVMMGLADDGGLLVPNELPFVESNLDKWRPLSFKELSLEIMLLLLHCPPHELWPLYFSQG